MRGRYKIFTPEEAKKRKLAVTRNWRKRHLATLTPAERKAYWRKQQDSRYRQARERMIKKAIDLLSKNGYKIIKL